VTIFGGLFLYFQSSDNDYVLKVTIVNTVFGLVLVTLGSIVKGRGIYYGGIISIIATITILDTTWAGVVGGLIGLSGGLWLILSSLTIKRE